MFVKTLLDRLTLEPEIRLQVSSFRAFNYYGWSQHGHKCCIKKKQSFNSPDVGCRQDLIELSVWQSMLVLTLPPSGPQPHFPTSFAKQSHFPPTQCTQCIFLSFPCPGSICFVHWDGKGRGGEEWRDIRNQVSRRLLCNQRASSHGAPRTKTIRTHIHPTHWASTHSPLPHLTNVPWHSYITRKLAKWINHGPCLALRALNGFSPLQVCPIIAFIHLVEARFTHSRRSCQSPDTFSALVARVWEICHRIITGNSNNN